MSLRCAVALAAAAAAVRGTVTTATLRAELTSGFLAHIGADNSAPWGVHIAYGADPSTQMTIMWSTRDAVPAPVVTAGVLSGAPAMPLKLAAEVIPFKGDTGNVQTLYRATLGGLQPGNSYLYQVGDGGQHVSAIFNFTTRPLPSAAWRPTFAIYGDLGISANGQETMPWLLQDALSGALDVVLHIGDAAYNLDSNGGATGDAFMVQIAPLAANVPYHIW